MGMSEEADMGTRGETDMGINGGMDMGNSGGNGAMEARNELEREKAFLYWMCSRVKGLGAVSIRRIGEYAGNFEEAYYIEGMELCRQGILKREAAGAAYDQAKGEFEDSCKEYQALGERGIRFITPLDEEYPGRLRNIYDYPMGLWIKGQLPEEGKPAAAIVGSRNCTSYGEQAAEYMGRELAKNGIQIISGLALGIDGAGHKGALAAGGGTWAVLGCGVNVCYPRNHFPLYQSVLKNGGIISEYPPSASPQAFYFPVRNRLISALSDVILVIEAGEKSGSLITAHVGLEQGKEIFALPGRITDRVSRGCNMLIRDGAAILTSPADVLEYLGVPLEKKSNSYEKEDKGLAKTEKMVYSFLDCEPKHIEEICGSLNLEVSRCMEILLDLELGGMIERTAGQYYVRRVW